MPCFVCATCGVQYAESAEPPARCAVCEDPRQWVPEDGQRWTTSEELRAGHANAVRPDGELTGVGTEPSFAIGQRALLVPHGDRHVLWECMTVLDDTAGAEIDARGGLSAIAISHPHYYGAMVDWAHRFDCPVLLHEDDREWVMRPDPSVELWSGETRDLGGGLTLVRCGGHFRGGTVLHWAGGADGAGALLSGDIVQVIPDRRHVAFMWSYPNLIPLPDAEVQRIAAVLEPLPFEPIYGAWWGRVVRGGGKDAVRRSAVRHGAALRGELL